MRHRRGRVLTCLACIALLAAGCTGGGHPGSSGRTRSASAADKLVATYLSDWSAGKLGAAAALSTDPAAAATALRASAAGLGASSGAFAAAGTVRASGTSASARFRARWTIPGLAAPWTYTGTLTLRHAERGWKVAWAPADVHPGLAAGQHLSATRALPARAALTDAAGKPLFTPTPVVDVGIEPQLVTNLPSLAKTLAAALGVDAAGIVRSVTAAKPDAFVGVITLREPAYQRVRARIHDLPGTVFRSGTRLLGPSPAFARLLLGSVGPATPGALRALGPGYLATDQVGVSGLQQAENKQLTGKPGLTVRAAPGGQLIASVAPTPGTPVHTTLDVATQNAADTTLTAMPLHASIVAMRASTGEILAVANSPSTPYDIALSGRYPAGSTFKIVTASALLERGVVAPTARVQCPGTLTVSGKVFHNENSFALGTVSLAQAFAYSCNTSFIGLAGKLGPAALGTTAAQFGIGDHWTLPVDAFSGSVPRAAGATEQAADAIGQGKVLVSPLAMTVVAATTVHGSAPAPTLIAGIPGRSGTPPPPPAGVLAPVRRYLRDVASYGTAKLLRTTPGGVVSGKTGTAEFGTDVPPKAHSWFTGVQGDLAFTVFVEGGEASQTEAVPLAAKFLTALHAGA